MCSPDCSKIKEKDTHTRTYTWRERQTDKQTHTQTHTHTDRQTIRQNDAQIVFSYSLGLQLLGTDLPPSMSQGYGGFLGYHTQAKFNRQQFDDCVLENRV